MSTPRPAATHSEVPYKDHEQHIRLTVDIVIFTIKDGKLSVLLIKRKYPPFQGQFAIPGGYVQDKESLEAAAARELAEETGVHDVFLKKLTAYGDVGRDPRGRIVSVAFMALIDSHDIALKAQTDAEDAQWIAIADVGKLAFDHNTILTETLATMRSELAITNIAAKLLPEKFSLSELQITYEEILGHTLDKRNFIKRIKELDLVQETGEQRRGGAHRPAQLYRFSARDYHSLEQTSRMFF